MDCRHQQLMRCQKCGRVWCVPAIVGPAAVWHRKCDTALEVLLSPEGVGECSRGVVSYFREPDRLEVVPDVERT